MAFDQPVEAVVAEAFAQVFLRGVAFVDALVVAPFKVAEHVPLIGDVLDRQPRGLARALVDFAPEVRIVFVGGGGAIAPLFLNHLPPGVGGGDLVKHIAGGDIGYLALIAIVVVVLPGAAIRLHQPFEGIDAAIRAADAVVAHTADVGFAGTR